jgi:hypothetical protein
MATRITVKSLLVLPLIKEIMVVKNATAITWDMYCSLAGHRLVAYIIKNGNGNHK